MTKKTFLKKNPTSFITHKLIRKKSKSFNVPKPICDRYILRVFSFIYFNAKTKQLNYISCSHSGGISNILGSRIVRVKSDSIEVVIISTKERYK